jgi:hypothetical protein
MLCKHCGWPANEASVLSTHRTSQGWVRYRRCICGTMSIELAWVNCALETSLASAICSAVLAGGDRSRSNPCTAQVRKIGPSVVGRS